MLGIDSTHLNSRAKDTQRKPVLKVRKIYFQLNKCFIYIIYSYVLYKSIIEIKAIYTI